ncbi:ATP-binding cassette domain-containing protein [bacterium]|nr:ATP-binding cassette domain-containing protein [bacterium]NUN45058.1 ATP-binding cassette domain-containing protein [bacterium]
MIRVENLTKDYGSVRALNSISFEVQDGEILGFLGPNGAGKSTTLKIITSYLAPTSGNVFINDRNILDHSLEIRKQIGYLPELNPLYYEMTVYDFLKFVAAARQIESSAFTKRLGEVIELCGLRGVVHKTIAELSKGYKQRVGLAQAIFHDPKILILDEPSTGLDPNQIVEIRELIKNLGKKKTLIMSSHILQEVQATADRMVIINKGQIVANGTTAELMAGFKGKTVVTMELLNAQEEAVRKLQGAVSGITVTQVTQDSNALMVRLEYPNQSDPRKEIFEYAVQQQWAILEMSRHKVSLEDIFRTLTVEGGQPHA